MEEAPKLGIEAAKIAAQAHKPMPSITVAAPVLRPFPWSKRGEVKAAVAKVAVAADAPIDVSLDQYARVCAELAMVSRGPFYRLQILERHGLNAESYAAVESQWQAALSSNSELAADHRRLVAHHRARLQAAAKQIAQQREWHGPAAACDMDPRAAAVPKPLVAEADLPEPDVDELSVDETALLTAALVGEVLPFRDPTDSHLPPPRSALEPSPEAGETAAFIPALTANDALPFGGSWVDASESDVNETAIVGALAPEDALPFSDQAAQPPPSATPSLADQEMSGETAMIDPNIVREISNALPFGTTQHEPELDEEPTPPSAKVAVSTPRSAETSGHASLPPNLARWAIENYASLCAECAIRPRERAQIHARYHIADDTERAALDAYWEDRMAKDRALAMRFRELVMQARDWVQSPSTR